MQCVPCLVQIAWLFERRRTVKTDRYDYNKEVKIYPRFSCLLQHSWWHQYITLVIDLRRKIRSWILLIYVCVVYFCVYVCIYFVGEQCLRESWDPTRPGVVFPQNSFLLLLKWERATPSPPQHSHYYCYYSLSLYTWKLSHISVHLLRLLCCCGEQALVGEAGHVQNLSLLNVSIFARAPLLQQRLLTSLSLSCLRTQDFIRFGLCSPISFTLFFWDKSPLYCQLWS